MWLEDLAKGGVEGFGNAIKSAVSAFKADPTKVEELTQAVTLAAMQFSSSVIGAVNATMQAEAKSEHWLQWSWRPLVGYTFIATVLNNYFLYSYMAHFGVVKVDVPSEVWLAMLAVLGVAAYTRGVAQIEEVKRNGK